MARRIWVKNPRVKGGGYWRRGTPSAKRRAETARLIRGSVGRGRREEVSDFGPRKIKITQDHSQLNDSTRQAHRESELISSLNRGDKQPRSTRPPKSRKPKKTGRIKSDRIRTSEMHDRIRARAKARKATKATVKKASGKKRTLSEAQKAAKRTRAKARRAKRRK